MLLIVATFDDVELSTGRVILIINGIVLTVVVALLLRC